MTEIQERLRGRFSAFLRWDNILDRERVWVYALFYATLLSLILLPVKSLFPEWIGPWIFPPTFFFVLVPLLYFKRRRGKRSDLQTVLRLDRSLTLEETGVTAWEILRRPSAQDAELLVLEEADARLNSVTPQSVFKRILPWQAWGVPPVLLLWTFLLWFGFEVHWEGKFRDFTLSSVAQTLKRFSQEVKERARQEGLKQSFEVARRLEQTADQRIRGELDEKALREKLAEVENTIARKLPGVEQRVGAHMLKGQRSLEGQLENVPQARELSPDLFGKTPGFPEQQEKLLEDLLASGAWEGGELERQPGDQDRSAGDQMDQQTLAQIQQFLKNLLEEEKGGGSLVDESAKFTVAGKGQSSSEEKRGKGEASIGDRPGSKELVPQPSPSFRAEVATHLRGLIRKGQTRAIRFRAQSEGPDSKVSEEAVLKSYEKQMEVEMASEAIPIALKEPIKKYFVSLGLGTQAGGE